MAGASYLRYDEDDDDDDDDNDDDDDDRIKYKYSDDDKKINGSANMYSTESIYCIQDNGEIDFIVVTHSTEYTW